MPLGHPILPGHTPRSGRPARRAVSLLRWSGRRIEVPFFLRENGVCICGLAYTHSETAPAGPSGRTGSAGCGQLGQVVAQMGDVVLDDEAEGDLAVCEMPETPKVLRLYLLDRRCKVQVEDPPGVEDLRPGP